MGIQVVMRIISVGIAVLSLCSGAFAETQVRVNGSGAALDAMKPIAAAFMKANPGVKIVIDKPLGSSGALKALLANALDVAVSSKPVKPDEVKQGAIVREYGKTPLLFVVNRNVPITALTGTEAEEYYAGKRTAWSDGTPVRLVLRPEGDIDTTILRSLSPSMNSAITQAMGRPGMITSVTDPEAADMVVKTPGALGAASLSTVIVENPSLKSLPLNGVKASVGNLRNGSYPMGKDVRFVTTSRTPQPALKFLEFVFSAKGRAIAEKSGVWVTAPVREGK